MTEGPSRYAGIAAAMVFGVGLLLVGNVWSGLGVLGFSGLLLAITTGKIFALAVGALICSGIFAYCAASNEITGTASYQPGIRGRAVTVTRQQAPVKFREVTNLRWGLTGLFLLAGVAGFILCQKLEKYSADYV